MATDIQVENQEYVVRHGDNFFSIAESMLGGDASQPQIAAYAQELAFANGGLSTIRSGQTLRVPGVIVGENAKPTADFMSAARGETPTQGSAVSSTTQSRQNTYFPSVSQPSLGTASQRTASQQQQFTASTRPQQQLFAPQSSRFALEDPVIAPSSRQDQRFREGQYGSRFSQPTGIGGRAQAQARPQLSATGAPSRQNLAAAESIVQQSRQNFLSALQPSMATDQSARIASAQSSIDSNRPRVSPVSSLKNPPTGQQVQGARLTTQSFRAMQAADLAGDVEAFIQYRPNYILDSTRAQIGVSPFEMTENGYIRSGDAWVNSPAVAASISSLSGGANTYSGFSEWKPSEAIGTRPLRGGYDDDGSDTFIPQPVSGGASSFGTGQYFPTSWNVGF